MRKSMRCNHFFAFREKYVIQAVVPILHLSDSYSRLEVDININNVGGIHNTHLIHHYARLDERFPTLCLLVKHWARSEKINSAKNGTLSSYSLILLVLHYMQCVAQPAVLPNLQELCPDTFNGTTPVELLKFNENVCTYKSENLDDFDILLLGFFHYYRSFDFSSYAISVRKACVYPKASRPKATLEQGFFVIEEPYDCTHELLQSNQRGLRARIGFSIQQMPIFCCLC